MFNLFPVWPLNRLVNKYWTDLRLRVGKLDPSARPRDKLSMRTNSKNAHVGTRTMVGKDLLRQQQKHTLGWMLHREKVRIMLLYM